MTSGWRLQQKCPELHRLMRDDKQVGWVYWRITRRDGIRTGEWWAETSMRDESGDAVDIGPYPTKALARAALKKYVEGEEAPP
jgi:hypothetical protein